MNKTDIHKLFYLQEKQIQIFVVDQKKRTEQRRNK